MRLSEMAAYREETSVPNCIQRGSVLRCHDEDGNHADLLVSQVDASMMGFIALDDGNRWGKPVKVESVSRISRQELKKIVGDMRDLNDFEYLGEASDVVKIEQ